MNQQVAARRNLTESSMANRLGVERLEVYLLAAALKLGSYDSITHLLLFSDDEASAMESHLRSHPA